MRTYAKPYFYPHDAAYRVKVVAAQGLSGFYLLVDNNLTTISRINMARFNAG